ncbi:GNAT family N-acetyltransferase [Frondihabitans sp. VKM Ac-2883]|uniref:GNAT family N-acetyltransferase n=1 Tax=Frondihabitans sp. VKM Ac-2883 TaxID=2783823 RepID=UPI00188A7F5D|nr:GNAT family N-acetyltransferase [Frondihabitans sp. VKM Ac-2883]
MTSDIAPRPFRPSDAAELTTLLNSAYQELEDAGLNFTAATQNVETTRQRVAEGVCWVVEHNGRVAASMTMSVPPPEDVRSLSEHAQEPATGWLCQVAVGPELRGRAVAKTLFDGACAWATKHGLTKIGLDTAAPARHLVAMYARWGFEHVDSVRFPDKRYDSVVMTLKVIDE